MIKGEPRRFLPGHYLRGTHGYAPREGKRAPTYLSWKAMRARCNYKEHRYYKYYGGCGIAVCERWDSFINFLEDMGERPEGKSLDRINPYGNYEPSNCRWATQSEQVRNQRPRGFLETQRTVAK